jgi:hypothetical protein
LKDYRGRCSRTWFHSLKKKEEEEEDAAAAADDDDKLGRLDNKFPTQRRTADEGAKYINWTHTFHVLGLSIR